MVGVDDHHLRGATRRAAGFDRAGGAVADLEKTHQPGGAAAAGQFLAVAAQFREVGTGARAVFEQARLAHPQIHDPAFVDEIVGDGLDKTGVRLRVLVGAFGSAQLAGAVIDVIVTLGRPIDAIGPVEPGVEPLRRVRGAHLARQHQPQFVVEGAGILFALEIAALPGPIGPGAGQPVEALLGAGLAAAALPLRQHGERGLVRGAAPQPGRDALFLDRGDSRRHPGLAQIFLGQDVASDLAPLGRDLDSLGSEHDRPVGVADFAGGAAEGDAFVWIPPGRGKTTRDVHWLPPKPQG